MKYLSVIVFCALIFCGCDVYYFSEDQFSCPRNPQKFKEYFDSCTADKTKGSWYKRDCLNYARGLAGCSAKPEKAKPCVCKPCVCEVPEDSVWTAYDREYLARIRRCSTQNGKFEDFYDNCLGWERNVEAMCEPGPNLEFCTGPTKAYYEWMLEDKQGERP